MSSSSTVFHASRQALSLDPCARLGVDAGAAAVLRYGEMFDDVPLVVNLSGRFNTGKTPRSRFTDEQWRQLDETGSFMWKIKVGGGAPAPSKCLESHISGRTG